MAHPPVREGLMQRLRNRAQFQAVLAGPPVAKTAHFALHRAPLDGGRAAPVLFPSAEAYHDSTFPSERLKMLAVKTTCRDRWRQILNEADRIPAKHLLTLQEGVSESQFREVTGAGVQARTSVPESRIVRYPVGSEDSPQRGR